MTFLISKTESILIIRLEKSIFIHLFINLDPILLVPLRVDHHKSIEVPVTSSYFVDYWKRTDSLIGSVKIINANNSFLSDKNGFKSKSITGWL